MFKMSIFQIVGQMAGAIKDLEESDYSSSEDEEENEQPTAKKSGGMFSLFKGKISKN